MTKQKKLYRFAYYVRSRDSKKELRPFQIRDGAAFSEISSLLFKQGYEYNGILFNKSPKDNENIELNLSKFNSEDIIVLCTRPPLHSDKEKGPRKRLKRSATNLEEKIFQFLKNFFEICTRDKIKLQKEVTQGFETGFENRANIEYRQNYNTTVEGINNNASYKRHKKIGEIYWEDSFESEKTAAYFIHTKELWKNGPSLLVSRANASKYC